MIRSFLMFTARLIPGLLFIYSGAMKLLEPAENFRGVIAQYEVIPYFLIPAIAAVIPWVEFLSGLFLAAGFLPRISARILAGLSLAFALLLLSQKIFGGDFPADCGCFGGGKFHLSGLQVLFLDTANFLLLLWLSSRPRHPLSLEKWLTRA